MEVTAAIASLRELIETAAGYAGCAGYQGRDYWPCPGVQPGIPKGAISEICGVGKTEFAVRFLAENPDLKVAWIEDQLSVYPCAVSQKRGRLQRILFAEAGSESFWAVSQALRSQLFGAVVFSSTTTAGEMGQAFCRDERALRSLQLAAEKSQSAMLILSDRPTGAWPISLQLCVKQRSGGTLEEAGETAAPLRVEILKRR